MESKPEPRGNLVGFRKVYDRLGITSRMQAERWMKTKNMPRPVAQVGGRNFWDENQIEAFRAKLEADYVAGVGRWNKPLPPRRKHRRATTTETTDVTA